MNNGMYPNTNYQQPQNMYGYNYGVPRPQAKNSQYLTADQIAKLRYNDDSFSMKIDENDLLRAICTHKEANGANSLVEIAPGRFRCTICQQEFNMFEGNDEDIDKAVDTIIDMFQTIKTIYLDAPDSLAEYYTVIPLLKKLVKLWKTATINFSKYDGNYNVPIQTGSNYSGFQAIQNMLINPYGYGQPMMYPQQQFAPQQGAPMAQGYPQQNGYPQQPQQPMMYPNPAYQYMAQQGMNMQDVNNPMGYNAPAPGVMPNNQPPVADPATTQQGEVQQQKTFNV